MSTPLFIPLDSAGYLHHPQEALTHIAASAFAPPINHQGEIRKIALYDMDRTITVRGTYADFLRFMGLRFAPWRILLIPLLMITSIFFVLRLVSRQRLKELNLWIVLGPRIDRKRMALLLDAYAVRVVEHNIRPLALRQMAADSAAGWQIVIATASFALYVEPIAERLGIAPDNVIATQLQSGPNGIYTPRIAGRNCYGADKLDHVQTWMATQGIDRSGACIRFYSDHVSDAPCLHFADDAVATTPHAALRSYAHEQGWTIVDW